MGNRAVITTEDKRFGIYLHWNGGRDSVEAFLLYCKMTGQRPPEHDNYGWARLCQVIGNYFGGTTSIGMDLLERLDQDNWDNGVYVIKNWEIIDRENMRRGEQEEYGLVEMMLEIHSRQPGTVDDGKMTDHEVKIYAEQWLLDHGRFKNFAE